jgi:hypothetical protein
MMKSSLKRIVPPPLWNAARQTWDAIGRIPELPGAYLHPWRRASMERLGRLKDIHRGQRCFIIGNGPSLKQTDLSRLRNEFTFGMNRFYMAFEELGFSTTYFLSINDLVVEQSAADLQALPMMKFFSWRARQWMQPDEHLAFLYTSYNGPRFAQDVRGRLWEGATVTYTALQLAFHMGFEEVILIGVDHSFATKGAPNKTVVSGGDDPNHFHPGYFGKGFRWQLPDLDTSEAAYAMARATYENAGRQVVDATVGGQLEIFRKAPYEGLF